MERVYGTWALGPKAELRWVWGDYTDDGPEWDIDADESMVDVSMAGVGARAAGGRRAHPRRSRRWTAVAGGNGYSLRWNLQKLIGEYARHNGHADLIRERIDGRTGE